MTSGAQRARLQFYEHELGEWMRVRRAPDVRAGLTDDLDGNPWSFGTYDPYDYP